MAALLRKSSFEDIMLMDLIVSLSSGRMSFFFILLVLSFSPSYFFFLSSFDGLVQIMSSSLETDI